MAMVKGYLNNGWVKLPKQQKPMEQNLPKSGKSEMK
jgi:hypothetical protein